MPVFVDQWNVVHTSPAAALGDRGRNLESSPRKPPISSRPGWHFCGVCGRHIHDDELLVHKDACKPEQLNVPVRQSVSTVRRIPTRPQGKATGSNLTASSTNVSSGPAHCPRCLVSIRPLRLAKHLRRVHSLEPRGVESGATGPSTIRPSSQTNARQFSKVCSPRVPELNLSNSPADTDADPLGLRRTCGRCSKVKVAGPLGIVWFHYSAHKWQVFEQLRTKAEIKRLDGLAPCSSCTSFVRKDRLQDHLSSKHGQTSLVFVSSTSSSPSEAPHSAPKRTPMRPRKVLRPETTLDDPEEFDDGVAADVRGQARRHHLDASPDGRYFRDQGSFGSHPSFDGYGDESWS